MRPNDQVELHSERDPYRHYDMSARKQFSMTPITTTRERFPGLCALASLLHADYGCRE